MQNYGGAAFDSLRTSADKIFMNLGPPKPSREIYDNSTGARCSASVMSGAAYSRTYYNNSNGCFAGDCVVAMFDGSCKLVERVRKGDVVRTPEGRAATVDCVVKTLTEDGRCDMVLLDNGLKSTPYHPILWKGSWTFPKDVKAATVGSKVPAVYSFAMENRDAAMIINGVSCITLAHGIQDDPVASHSYFGTEAIVDDLKKLGGAAWKNGLVVLDYGAMRRLDEGDSDTRIVGIYEERVVEQETEEAAV